MKKKTLSVTGATALLIGLKARGILDDTLVSSAHLNSAANLVSRDPGKDSIKMRALP